MKRQELIKKARSMGIKGAYRMKKADLEQAIFLKDCLDWFNETAGCTITITDEGVDISLNTL